MSDAQNIKEHVMGMAVSEIEILLNIIGDLGYKGYKVTLCKLRGNSYQQCATKTGLTLDKARYAWEKSLEKKYDIALRKMFNL